MSSQALPLRRPSPRVAPIEAWRGSLLGRNPAVRRMVLAAFVSTCGDRLHQVALAALILGLTNSLASAGLVFIVSTVPYVLFGLPIGALVDRWDRRTTMIVADLIRGLLVLALPLVAVINVPLVYCVLFVLSCATIAYAPARQAALPDLVTGDELPAANTSFQAVNYVVDLFALPLAGLVVAVLIQQHGVERGTFMVFGLDAISYVASAALLRRLPRQQTPAGQRHRPPGELLSQIAEGLRFLARDPHLRTNTLLLTLGPLMLGSLHTLWIGFAWRVSHTETLGYGIVEAANAIGTLVGLYVLRHVGARLNPGRTILLGFAVMGSAIASVGWSDSLAVVACLAALGGLGNMLFLVPSITLVQRRTPSELRGRVFAVRMMLTFAAFSMSNALAGGLADSIGVGPLFVVLGSGMLLLAAIGGLFASARDAS